MSGAKGMKRDRGLPGFSGAKGIKEERGLHGSSGTKGIKGDRGFTGSQGLQGINPRMHDLFGFLLFTTRVKLTLMHFCWKLATMFYNMT